MSVLFLSFKILSVLLAFFNFLSVSNSDFFEIIILFCGIDDEYAALAIGADKKSN